MLHLDLTTLLFCDALITTLCCVYLVLNTAFGIDDYAGRIWSVSFLSGIVVTGSYIVWGLNSHAWWAVAVGNGAFTLAGGLLWAGTRAFNGRRPLSLYPALAAAVVAGAAAVQHDVPGGWGGTPELFASVIVFGALAGIEMMRGVGSASPNGVVFSCVMWLTSAVYLARLIAFLVLGPADQVFITWFGTTPTTVVFIVFIFCASVSLTILRLGVDSRASGPSHSDAALMTMTTFEGLARRWLSRAAEQHRGLALAEVRLHGLHEVAVAFGHVARKQTLGDFVSLVVTRMPHAALPARATEDRMLVLFPVPDAVAAREELRAVVEAAQSVQAEATGMRMMVGVSFAHTADAGYDLQTLTNMLASGATAIVTNDTAQRTDRS